MILFSAFLVQRAVLYMVTIVQLFCYALLWFGVVCTLVVDHLLDCFKALPLIWDVEGFKDVREWCVVTTDPCDGGLQVEKTLLLQEANRFSVGSSFSQSGKPCRCLCSDLERLMHIWLTAESPYKMCHVATGMWLKRNHNSTCSSRYFKHNVFNEPYDNYGGSPLDKVEPLLFVDFWFSSTEKT